MKTISKKKFNNKTLLVLMILFVSCAGLKAQVTIGSDLPPHEKALLDIKEKADGSSTKGVILPRVVLASTDDFFGSSAHEKGTVVYNTKASTNAISVEKRVSTGFYYNTGEAWEKLQLGYNNWFYMPSVPVKASNDLIGQTQTVDLYDLYMQQFNIPAVKSAGAPDEIRHFAGAGDLYYYVTSYDKTVFDITSITADGKMTYTVLKAAEDDTYLNIVFVIK